MDFLEKLIECQRVENEINQIENELRGSQAVSYTHLDVYKRQLQEGIGQVEAAMTQRC